jgi:hypothetical protein
MGIVNIAPMSGGCIVSQCTEAMELPRVHVVASRRLETELTYAAKKATALNYRSALNGGLEASYD